MRPLWRAAGRSWPSPAHGRVPTTSDRSFINQSRCVRCRAHAGPMPQRRTASASAFAGAGEWSMFDGIHHKWRGRWERRRLRNRVIKALTLAPRGAVRDDGPRVREMSLALRLEWHARDIHPWDCDLPADRRAELFTEELMSETIAAIRQAFERLAEVDVIEIR